MLDSLTPKLLNCINRILVTNSDKQRKLFTNNAKTKTLVIIESNCVTNIYYSKKYHIKIKDACKSWSAHFHDKWGAKFAFSLRLTRDRQSLFNKIDQQLTSMAPCQTTANHSFPVPCQYTPSIPGTSVFQENVKDFPSDKSTVDLSSTYAWLAQEKPSCFFCLLLVSIMRYCATFL